MTVMDKYGILASRGKLNNIPQPETKGDNMKKILITGLALLAGIFSASAYCAPGEWWEVSSKMEMPGMPFAMPATTSKICIPKGGANDPRQSMQDKECKMTDVKFSGNKTSWKVTCNHNGEVMNGTGDITSTPDSYNGKMHLSGVSGGEKINMTTTYQGKRVGPACESSQPPPEVAEAQKQIDQSCETDKKSAVELINIAELFLAKNPMCRGKSKVVCGAIRKEVSNDADAYSALVMHDKQAAGGTVSIAKACGLDMAATTRSICKNINGKNYKTLTPHCPAEAKEYRVAMRKKECEGRSYTAQENLSRCINAEDSGGEQAEDAGSGNDAESGKAKSGTNNPADAVIDGAKKLKGLFGF